MDFKNEDILKRIIEVLESKLGDDLVVLNIKDISSVADYFVIVSADSHRKSIALSQNIQIELEKMNITPKTIEGQSTGDWVLMDYYDIVIHIFYEEDRKFYDLERLWLDAPKVELIDGELVVRSIEDV